MKALWYAVPGPVPSIGKFFIENSGIGFTGVFQPKPYIKYPHFQMLLEIALT